MEPSAFTAIFTVSRTARSILTELRKRQLADDHKELVQEALDVVTDLGDRLLEIQSTQSDLKHENDELKAKLAAANDWNKRRANYRLFQTPVGGMVLESIEGTPKHFACLTCAESRKEIHPLQKGDEYTGSHTCAACKSSYDTFKAKDPDYSAFT